MKLFVSKTCICKKLCSSEETESDNYDMKEFTEESHELPDTDSIVNADDYSNTYMYTAY